MVAALIPVSRLAMLRTLRRHRHRFIAVTFALLTLYLLSAVWNFGPQTESARLALFMNSEDTTRPTSATGGSSSFNWSSVPFQYVLAASTELPVRSRKRGLPRVQHKFRSETLKEALRRESRRGQVRDLFQRDWQSYREFAWMKDALKPISGGFTDQFSGWAATLVDSLDTLWIMGLKEEFEEAVAAVAQIDFGNSTSPRVNTFETNIRYLGGLIAAYDLSKRPILLTKARELGDLLYAAFNTVNRMPVDFIDFERAKTGEELFVEETVVSASPGTLSLELTRLSQILGESKYYSAVNEVMKLFFQYQNQTSIPGLWPTFVSMKHENLTSGKEFTLAGGADSLYEYLPKMNGLLQGAEPMYDIMSRQFLEAANRHMFFRPMLPNDEDVLISGIVNVESNGDLTLNPEAEHLSCYLGGAFALAGRLLDRPDHIRTGERLTKGCVYVYQSMSTGVGPERWNMAPCVSRDHCGWDEETWARETDKRPEWLEHLPKGFTTVKDPRYILRPEAIESVFVLYRITGRQEYQDAAWDMFRSIRNTTNGTFASASIIDVTKRVGQVENEDYMESFWFAETLKYFYLVFSPPDLISLDEFVLNTEAHPFHIV